MLTQLKRLLFDESGQGLAEYGLILALIAIVVIGVLVAFGDKLVSIFTTITEEIPE
ncbi:MAG: Flp family type IVb pilin [Firmicutes bacterium]|nr:Flp family type IVb pilin [Bacillota bacterium]NLL87987.1 Flp family type IVb pilin [Bacillota bacterium]HKM16973.1 Flp family type IVb pilin [Limnochordia bacterium]